MSDNILADSGKIKEIVVKCKGTPAQKLLAILEHAGVNDVAELAAMMGVTDRYVRKARNQSSGTEPEFRNQSSEDGTRVPEKRNQSSAEKKVSPTPPSKNNNLELTLKSNSSVAAREVAAAPLKVDLGRLAEQVTAACNGSLASQAIAPGLASMSIPLMWIEHGADLDRDVLPALTVAGKKYHGKGIRSWDYFTPMVAEAKAKREKGLPAVDVSTRAPSGYRSQPPPLIPFNDTIVQTQDLEDFARSCLVE
jgi:hypothetical protein